MRHSHHKPDSYYLKPGELFCGDKATVVSTLLGSCVAVTMYSPRCRVGAICHGLLPSRRGDHTCVGVCDEGPRYMDCAIRLMLDWFTLRGILQAEIDIKVFGGSDMFSATGGEPRMPTVGRQNIEKTMDIIESKGLRLLASDLGGMRGRKIFFSTHTGEVLLKKMNRSQFKE